MTTLNPDSATRPPIWGPWATIGFGVLVALAFVLVQVLVVTVYFLASAEALPGMTEEHGVELEEHGLLLAIATLATAPVCAGLVVLFAWARRGLPVGEYLALARPPAGVLLRWLAGAMLLIVVADLVTWASGRPIVPEFMRATYTSAEVPALFWIAIVVAAPVFEELFFRGFLLRGLAASRLGVTGAVILTALVWAFIHVQYEFFYLLIIFVGGLFLGYARVRSGSTLLTIALHGAWNLIATLQVALLT